MDNRKRILITGARSMLALELSRHFAHAGHIVYVADSWPITLSRFSNAVTDSFTIPSARYQTAEFIQGITQLIHAHQIDLVVPIFEETFYLSQHLHQLPTDKCHFFLSPFESVHRLHNKYLFQQRLSELGIKSIPTELIHAPDMLQTTSFPKPAIVKACYSRASLQVHRYDENKPAPQIDVSEQNPWIIQTFLTGKKYCTYSVCHAGRVLASSTYPVKIAIDGSSCILFEAIEHPGIVQWIQHFVASEKYTGQIGFDFIETDDGSLYAIECNPRATSGVHLFTAADGLADAFLNNRLSCAQPKVGTRRQLGMGMLLYGWRSSSSKFRDFIKYFLTSPDVVFHRHDLTAFFMLPWNSLHIWREARKHKLSLPAVFYHDLEWNKPKENK